MIHEAEYDEKTEPTFGTGALPKDYIPAEQAAQPKLWERTPGIPEWLEKVSIWTENLAGTAMTVLSVGWMCVAWCAYEGQKK